MKRLVIRRRRVGGRTVVVMRPSMVEGIDGILIWMYCVVIGAVFALNSLRQCKRLLRRDCGDRKRVANVGRNKHNRPFGSSVLREPRKSDTSQPY